MHLFGLPGYWARHAGMVMRVIGETRPIGGRSFNIAFDGGSGGSSDRVV